MRLATDRYWRWETWLTVWAFIRRLIAICAGLDALLLIRCCYLRCSWWRRSWLASLNDVTAPLLLLTHDQPSCHSFSLRQRHPGHIVAVLASGSTAFQTSNLSKAHETRNSLSSSYSQVVLIYLYPFRRNSLLKSTPQPQIAKKTLNPYFKSSRSFKVIDLSLIHIWRCRRIERCRSRWSPYH